MRQEDLDWFEENWHKGKRPKKSITNNKEYKVSEIYPHKWEDRDCHLYYWNDNHYKNWKEYRKTQYRVKQERKQKKRKAWYKEHWRFKSPVESKTWGWRKQHRCYKPTYCTWEQWWSAEGFVKSLKAGDKIYNNYRMMLVMSKGFNYYSDEEYVRVRPIYETDNFWYYNRDEDEYEYDGWYNHLSPEILHIRDFIKFDRRVCYHQNKY